MFKRLFHPRVIAPMLAGLIGGALLSSVQFSCGSVQPNTCAAEDCPPGPAGPAGPAGPRGPGFGSCTWLYMQCGAGAGVECQQVCPAGTHPIAGSCDAAAGATIVEHRASTGAATFPPTPAPFTAYDRWVCETSTGNMQFTYALCCAP
jgi:hypothetical protein